MDVKDGDRVLYSKYAGTEVKLDGKEYLVLSARDVLGDCRLNRRMEIWLQRIYVSTRTLVVASRRASTSSPT